MEKIRDFIPKTYMPILFGSLILAVFGLIGFINLFLPNGPDISSQLQEIKSLRNPEKYLFADTLVIDKQHYKSGIATISGRLKSNLNQKRRIVVTTIHLKTGGTRYEELENIFKCTGCKIDTNEHYCECLPVLRSNLHKEIYANNPDTLHEEAPKIIADIILETYLFWIVPFLFIYYKITQLLYHYLNRKINEKKR